MKINADSGFIAILGLATLGRKASVIQVAWGAKAAYDLGKAHEAMSALGTHPVGIHAGIRYVPVTTADLPREVRIPQGAVLMRTCDLLPHTI